MIDLQLSGINKLFCSQAAENLADYCLPFCLMFWSFAQIFLMCECGETLTSQFMGLNDAILQCDWYTFPIEVQQNLPIIIMGTRNPVVISGYGMILCTREAFHNVNVSTRILTMIAIY